MIDVARDNLIPLHGPTFKGSESVAKRFGVSRTTAHKWRTERGLECVKVGGRWFTTGDALNDFARDSSKKASRERRSASRRRTNPEHVSAMQQLERDFW